MASDLISAAGRERRDWSWRVGIVVSNPELLAGIMQALEEDGAQKVFEFPAAASSFEVAAAVDRERPDILFVELSSTSKSAAEWIADVRRGEEMPLIVAVHSAREPAEMIAALRAGACEFLSLPISPAIHEAMERMGVQLEARHNATAERGTIAGVVSAKGGCGATTVACHLAAAVYLASTQKGSLVNGKSPKRVLVADLDHQSPAAAGLLRVSPRLHSGDAFEAIRRLSTQSWREFPTASECGIDLLASPVELSGTPAGMPEQWRVEGLFRFIARQYGWIFIDLGRHLNPVNWTALQHINELFIVTAPDVLALYQTRSILQTLSSRGFDRSRTKILLNRNMSSPQDFWVESIEQMFELGVFGVIPNDEGTFGKLAGRDKFEFPADTPFGKAMMKIAGRLLKPGGPGQLRKAA